LKNKKNKKFILEWNNDNGDYNMTENGIPLAIRYIEGGKYQLLFIQDKEEFDRCRFGIQTFVIERVTYVGEFPKYEYENQY